MVAWLREHCPGVDGRQETVRFAAYWTARRFRHPPQVTGWDQLWRDWMLKAQQQAAWVRRDSPVSAGMVADGHRLAGSAPQPRGADGRYRERAQ
jgi:hypothetical protein